MNFILTPRDKLRAEEVINYQKQDNSNQVAGKAANSSTTCYHLQEQIIPSTIFVIQPSSQRLNVKICLAAAVDPSAQRETI